MEFVRNGAGWCQHFHKILNFHGHFVLCEFDINWLVLYLPDKTHGLKKIKPHLSYMEDTKYI